MNQNVKVNKNNLLETLRLNQADHAEGYKEAFAGYQIEIKEKVAECLREIGQGKVYENNFYLNIQAPQNHESDYDMAIKMAQWSVDETIELSPREFSQLVLDDWDWKQDFLRTQAMYVGKVKK